MNLKMYKSIDKCVGGLISISKGIMSILIKK